MPDPKSTTSDGRYVGRTLRGSFDGVAFSALYRSFQETDAAEEVDASAGADTRKQYVHGPKDGTLTATILDTTTHTAYDAFEVGAEGDLVWMPEGDAEGATRHTVDATVIERSRTFTYNDVTTFDVSLRMNEEITTDTVPA